jgi:hypothetical protein
MQNTHCFRDACHGKAYPKMKGTGSFHLNQANSLDPFDASVSERVEKIKALRSSSTGEHSGYPIVSIKPAGASVR